MRPIPWADLATAIDPAPRELIAIVGGGGKTTALFHLTHAFGGRTIATTTTRMGHGQHGGLPNLIAPAAPTLAAALDDGPVLVWGRRGAHKAVGVSPERCDIWFSDTDLCDNIVVEADGARHHPFKAPGPLEPVIPVTTTTVISVIGADALGRVIADQCHRPLRVAALAGCSPYERLTPERAARVLRSPDGGGRNVPAGARRIVVITKVPSPTLDPTTHDLAAGLSQELGAMGDAASIVVAIGLDPVDYRSRPWPSSD